MPKKLDSRSFVIIVFTAVFLFCGSFIFTSTSFAANTSTFSGANEIKVSLDGNYLAFDVPPTIIEGRTLVPLRVIFESLGANVNWNQNTSTVTGTKGDLNISLKVNSRNAYVNGSSMQIDVPATIIKGRTLVPARFIAESLGADVVWEQDTKTVVITSPKIVSFPDTNLEAAIRESLKKDKGDLSTGDLKRITALYASNKDISNLQGIQYLANLKELYLDSNKINDISLLSSNTNLEELSLDGNQITDLSPIKVLTKLSYINIGSNQITDISPLGSLPALVSLNLSVNQISDISALKDVPKLTMLNLWSNPVLNISVLKNLNDLKDLYILHYSKKDAVNSDLFNKFDEMSKKAGEVISEVIKPEMSIFEKELAIHDYIVTHTKYDKENLIKDTLPDETHTPYGVLINRLAVCDGYARTFQILLNSVGIESKTVIGDFDSLNGTIPGLSEENSKKWRHAWNMVKIDDKYYHVDVTADDPLADDGSDILSHQYFNISDKQIGVDHKWERTAYKECITDGITFAVNINEQRDIIIADDSYYCIDNIGLLHKKSLDGSKDVKLCDDTVSEIGMSGDWIFYLNDSDNKKIYKVKTDGTGRTKLNNEKSLDIKIYNNSLYYLTGDDYISGKISRMNFDGTGNMAINSYDITTWMEFSNDFIYYKAFGSDLKAGIFRIDLNGNGRIKLCNDEPTGFTLSADGREVDMVLKQLEFKVGDWIYFINESDGKKLYKVKADGSEKVKIGDDSVDTKSFEFEGDYFYYRNLGDNSKYYRINIDGTKRQLLE